MSILFYETRQQIQANFVWHLLQSQSFGVERQTNKDPPYYKNYHFDKMPIIFLKMPIFGSLDSVRNE